MIALVRFVLVETLPIALAIGSGLIFGGMAMGDGPTPPTFLLMLAVAAIAARVWVSIRYYRAHACEVERALEENWSWMWRRRGRSGS